ncbi:MAG: helicase-related protein, partial [Planctomycetaceae bacterium]
LMSYGTGSVGLNLQFCNYVFLFDRWWNPAIEDQAVNRAHRIGVKNPVIVTRFISRNTIEERIDRVLREKRELFEMVLGEGDNNNRSLSLSASEIFGLFDLKARHKDGARSIGPKPVVPVARLREPLLKACVPVIDSSKGSHTHADAEPFLCVRASAAAGALRTSMECGYGDVCGYCQKTAVVRTVFWQRRGGAGRRCVVAAEQPGGSSGVFARSAGICAGG